MILALPLPVTDCVTPDKLFVLSRSQSLCCRMELTFVPTTMTYGEVRSATTHCLLLSLIATALLLLVSTSTHVARNVLGNLDRSYLTAFDFASILPRSGGVISYHPQA